MPLRIPGRLMGYQLVSAAFQPEWAALLTPREHLVLIAMCHLALDEERDGCAAGRYFAGHDFLMLRTDGTDHHDGTDNERAAAEKAIQRAIRRLKEVGAIETVRDGKNGGKAEYQILVWQPALPVDNPRRRGSRSRGHPDTSVPLTRT